MNNRSKQHENLQKASQARHDATVDLMLRVLAYIAQTYRPPSVNCYNPKFLLSVAQLLQPGTTLHRSTLSNNLTVARLLEQARAATGSIRSPTPAKRYTKRKRRKPVRTEGDDKPNSPKRPKPSQKRNPLPDFNEILTWRPPKRLSPNWEQHRRATLSAYSKKDIAGFIVRLTDIRDYSEMRLAAIERAEWVSGPWPEDHHYPQESMPYDPTNDAHFASLLTRGKLKNDLITEFINLETETLGPTLRLEAYDARYLKPLINAAAEMLKNSPCRYRKKPRPVIKKMRY